MLLGQGTRPSKLCLFFSLRNCGLMPLLVEVYQILDSTRCTVFLDEITREVYRDQMMYVLWHKIDVRQKHTAQCFPSESAQTVCPDLCPRDVDRINLFPS